MDSDLDLSTFQLLAYSHHTITQILAGGIVRFNLPNINLPDSNSNEPLSHGYVQYKIKLKNNAANGTQISNTAYIYFDFNPAVVTNTTLNIISAVGIEQLSVNDNRINIYPNPTRGEFTLSFSNPSGEKARMKIYNILGETVFEKENIVSSPVLFNNYEISLQKGIYVVEVSFENYNEKRKLVVE
jgi:hypothetical protein